MDDLNGVISAGASLGGDYDELPYVSLPIAYTEPGRLAALARLYGLDAPDVSTARILELGCASGGNIIPLAARYPRARFLGVDLGERHVSEARARIRRLGLDNIEVRKADLASLSLEKYAFDVIICHGVYSWVPDAVQTAILDLCGRSLSQSGIAAVSYNVLPGWHLRSVIREICLSNDNPKLPVRERVAVARAAIELAAGLSNETSPYGMTLREEARRLTLQPASYILGEFLAAYNLPCHFKDFAARAAHHGLAYVSEGDLASSIPAMFLPQAAKRIASLGGDDPIARQHYCDLFSGRTFRRSILTRQDNAKLRTEPTPNISLDGLHVVAPLTPGGSGAAAGAGQFIDHRGQALRARDEIIAEAFDTLGRCYPSSVPARQLLSAAPGRSKRLLNRALVKIVAEGRATVSTIASEAGGADADRPCVWPVARQEAQSGQPWVTSLRHTAVRTNTALCTLYACMDGRTTRRDLAVRFEALRKARTPAKTSRRVRDQRRAPVSEELVSTDAFLSKAIAYAAHNALLLPDVMLSS